MKKSIYKSYDELPLLLNMKKLADLLDVSDSSVYELIQEDDFPSLRIGKGFLVPCLGAFGNLSFMFFDFNALHTMRFVCLDPFADRTYFNVKDMGSQITGMPLQNIIDYFKFLFYRVLRFRHHYLRFLKGLSKIWGHFKTRPLYRPFEICGRVIRHSAAQVGTVGHPEEQRRSQQSFSC